MARFLNAAPIAICDRCCRKRPHSCLVPDGNSSGLRVCGDSDCRDPFNPWRLPAIAPDRIALKWSRPDVPLNAGIPYRDFTNVANPQPPNSDFVQLEGLEGTGTSGTEDGIDIGLEGNPS